VTNGTRGQTLAITGSTSTTARFAWTDSVFNNWASRDAGSDTIYATWDQDTSTYASTAGSPSVNRFGAVIYDATGTKILAGMYVQANTGRVYGLSYSVSGTTAAANYAYSLTSGGNNVTVSNDVWNSFAVTFNKTTGRSEFWWNTGSSWSYAYVNGAASGVDPDEFDLYESANRASGSGSAGKAYYDNITVYSGSGTFVPAPGAVALLGVAGMIASRRRR